MDAFQAAKQIYTYGKHARFDAPGGGIGVRLSLANLATARDLSTVPGFLDFAHYYGSTAFADTLIRQAIEGTSSNDTQSLDRGTVILRSCQVLVLHFAALQALTESVSNCTAQANVTQSWDTMAALVIGILAGTEEGYMHYDLVQQFCVEFGTCPSSNSTAMANKKLITLLYSGRGATLTKSCHGFQTVGEEIRSLLLVPLIQGTLSASLKLSKSGFTAIDKTNAYIFSRALLPLIETVDSPAAADIARLLAPNRTSYYRSTASDMFTAFSQVYNDLGVECELIGGVPNFHACEALPQGPNYLWIIIWASAGLMLVLFLIIAARYMCARRTSRQWTDSIYDVGDDDEKLLAGVVDRTTNSFQIMKSFQERRLSLSSEAWKLTESNVSSDDGNSRDSLDDDNIFEAMTLLAGNHGRLQDGSHDII